MVLVQKADDKKLVSEQFLKKATERTEVRLIEGNNIIKNAIDKIRELQGSINCGAPVRNAPDFRQWLE